MHKSRLGGLSIDCGDGDLFAHAEFWSRALGRALQSRGENGDNEYYPLSKQPNAPDIEIQRVSHPSRVHIDIETDDVELETRRLEKLGARRIGRVRDWIVMQAPSGHRFCIVPAVAEDFDDEANVWE